MSRPRRTGSFAEEPTRPELERFFFLDDVDRDLIARRRSTHHQLGVEDPSVVKRYTEWPKTACEQAWEIRDAYEYHEYEDAEWSRRFRAFLYGRAWTHPEGPKAFFDQAYCEEQLPVELWEIARTLQQHSRLAMTEVLGGDDATGELRAAERRALPAVERRVEALELYAASAAEADRRLEELAAVEQFEARGELVLELLARTAADDVADADTRHFLPTGPRPRVRLWPKPSARPRTPPSPGSRSPATCDPAGLLGARE